MEKLLKPYDKEYMKIAMLKHEETFREQVYELHRLYQIQKMLMKSIKSSKQNFEKGENISNHHDIHKHPRQFLDLERPADDYIGKLGGDGLLEIEDENEIELTLGPSSYYRRSKATETPLTSDSGPSFSSSSTGSNHTKRTSSGTQRRKDKASEEIIGHKWGILEMPAESNPSFLSERKNGSVVEDQLTRDRLKQPSWLYQVLSLNMT